MTGSLATVTLELVNILKDNADALGLMDVWDGDQQLIPKTPCVTVEPVGKTRELDGNPRRVMNGFNVYLFVYHAEIVSSLQVVQRDCVILAEAIESLVNGYHNLNDLVIHGYCTAVELGVARRRKSLMAVTRIQWVGMSQSYLETRTS